jgi:regulator of sigma E protease
MYFLGDHYLPIKYVNENGGIDALEIAQKVGLQTGDKILKVNGNDIEYFEALTKPDVLISGDSYYTVERNGEIVDIYLPENFIENFDRRKAMELFMSYRVGTRIKNIAREITLKDDKGEKVKVPTVAYTLGLKENDKILAVNNKPVVYLDQIREIIKTPSDSISVTVARGSDTLTFKGSYKNHSTIGFAAEGIKKEDFVHIQYSLGQSIAQGPGRGLEVLVLQAKSIWKLVTGKISVRTISSPIGIAQAYGGTWDWERFWRMTGLISLALAFMNLLPIPGLDGGYVVFLLYEMISGREPSEKFFENSIKVGMALLLILMVFAFSNDIIKLFTN